MTATEFWSEASRRAKESEKMVVQQWWDSLPDTDPLKARMLELLKTWTPDGQGDAGSSG